MRNLSTGAVLLTCGLVVGCGNQQPENSQNLEPNAPAVAAENAGVAESRACGRPGPERAPGVRSKGRRSRFGHTGSIFAGS